MQLQTHWAVGAVCMLLWEECRYVGTDKEAWGSRCSPLKPDEICWWIIGCKIQLSKLNSTSLEHGSQQCTLSHGHISRPQQQAQSPGGTIHREIWKENFLRAGDTGHLAVLYFCSERNTHVVGHAARSCTHLGCSQPKMKGSTKSRRDD